MPLLSVWFLPKNKTEIYSSSRDLKLSIDNLKVIMQEKDLLKYFNGTPNPEQKLVRIFYYKKFEALSVSVCAFILWLSTRNTADGTGWSMLFSRVGMPFLVMLLISLTSWRMNLRAESSLAFGTAHSLYYVIQATVQDSIMYLCIGAFALFALFHTVAIPWFIVACVAITLIVSYKYRKAVGIFKCEQRLKSQELIPADAFSPEHTLSNFLCILMRYVAIGYMIYYFLTK